MRIILNGSLVIIVLVLVPALSCSYKKAEQNNESPAAYIAALASDLSNATGHQQMLIHVDDSDDGRHITITKMPATEDSYRSFLIKSDASVEEFTAP